MRNRLDQLFTPLLAGANWRDRIIATAGALIGIGMTALVCGLLSGKPEMILLVAPMGASAVLLYAVPSSPLAQPWPVVGGNTVSALIGIASALLLGHGALAAAIAVSVAILAMSVLRCLHPPGGACALLAVLGGPAVLSHGFGYALAPVALNALAMVAFAYAFHRVSGHSYPHRATRSPLPTAVAGFTLDDIDAALDEQGETFDVSREDLEALLASAERHAEARRKRR